MESTDTDNITLFKIGETHFSVSLSLYNEWHKKFSKDHISRSLPLAELWIFANQAKRPIRDIPNFLTNWLIKGAMMRRY